MISAARRLSAVYDISLGERMERQASGKVWQDSGWGSDDKSDRQRGQCSERRSAVNWQRAAIC